MKNVKYIFLFVKNLKIKLKLLENCKLDDACWKNKCQNESKCIQNDLQYKCECINQGYSGKYCEKCKLFNLKPVLTAQSYLISLTLVTL